MKSSFSLGRIAGIRLLVHWTFLLLIGWVVLAQLRKGGDTTAILLNVGLVLAVFGCVVLHELGHALAARRYGIETKKITLLPIGGLASLERIPDDPKQELWVALAGPAVNVVIALLLLAITPVFALLPDDASLTVSTFEGLLATLLQANIALVLFNLIPAFPMDGGRVLRALLALRLGRVRSTQIASSLGQFLAVGFVLWGLFNREPMLVLIGIFIFFGAQSESVVVQQLEFLKGHTVREAMMTKFITLSPYETVRDSADKLLAGSDQDLIVVENEEAVGIMTRALIINSLKEGLADKPVSEVMLREFGRLDINEKLTNAYTYSQQRKNAFFPVLENNKLRGVIDMANIHEFVMIQSALNY
jgi:Zn-dependent protease/predicted transcriptional regulator